MHPFLIFLCWYIPMIPVTSFLVAKYAGDVIKRYPDWTTTVALTSVFWPVTILIIGPYFMATRHRV